MQGSIFPQIIERLINQRRRILLNLSDDRSIARSEEAPAKRDVGLRVEKHVHVREQFPVVLRSAPRQTAAKRMASHAGRSHRFNRDRLVKNAVLCHIHDRPGFFRGKTVIGAEIFENRTGFGRGYLQTVQAHHPFDGFFPAFRCGALPGDARKVSLVIPGVAGSALCDDQRIGDRDAFFRFLFRSWTSRRLIGGLLALPRHHCEQSRKRDQECCLCHRPLLRPFNSFTILRHQKVKRVPS